MTDRPLCGVGAVVIENGRLLLVRRRRPPGEGLWAVPGGKVHWGESMSTAVRREVHEETGLLVSPGMVVWAGDSIGPGDPPSWHYCLVDFRASVDGGDLRPGDDALAVEWVPLADVADRPLTPTMFELLAVIEEQTGSD
ncbi:MAG: NUDIX hydrolase [Acidimicrobiia bacterium]